MADSFTFDSWRRGYTTSVNTPDEFTGDSIDHRPLWTDSWPKEWNGEGGWGGGERAGWAGKEGGRDSEFQTDAETATSQ